MRLPQRLIRLQWIGVAAGFVGFWLSWTSLSFGWHPAWVNPLISVLLLFFNGVLVYWLWQLRKLKQS